MEFNERQNLSSKVGGIIFFFASSWLLLYSIQLRNAVEHASTDSVFFLRLRKLNMDTPKPKKSVKHSNTTKVYKSDITAVPRRITANIHHPPWSPLRPEMVCPPRAASGFCAAELTRPQGRNPVNSPVELW